MGDLDEPGWADARDDRECDDSDAARDTPEATAEQERAREVSRYLGVDIRPEGLRALFVAAIDWGTDCANPGDYYIAGESLRALPEDERDAALRFFDDARLMQMVYGLMMTSPEISGYARQLDPVEGPASISIELDPSCERPAHNEGMGDAIYRAMVGRVRRRLLGALQHEYRHVVHQHRARPQVPSRRLKPHARPRGAGRPRAVASRSPARSGDSGDDGPGEPAPPGLTLRRHPRYGLLSPRLARLLDRIGVER